jgi:hypothetical protein
VQKIKRLRPFFLNGTVRLAEDLVGRLALTQEIMHFPKGKHDDFLDTLSDALSNKEGGVVSDVRPHSRRDDEPQVYDDGSTINHYSPPATNHPEPRGYRRRCARYRRKHRLVIGLP